MTVSGMVTPALPPCPVCGKHIATLEGFGARIWAEPCGHPVAAEFNAGGVQGSVVLRRHPDTPAN